jgi:hypothetical protein
MAESTFPISPEELISKAKQILSKGELSIFPDRLAAREAVCHRTEAPDRLRAD